jgi:serine protease AprX
MTIKKIIVIFVFLLLISNSGCLGIFDQNGWAVEITQINELHEKGLTGKGIIIGIVDTGIQANHSEFNDAKIIAWHDYVNEKQEPYDDNGHGTHVAGIISARGSWSGLFHGVKLKGIAPNAELVVVKAIPKNESGNDGTVADGINFCVDKGADIICLSLGGKKLSSIGNRAERACKNAIKKGVFVVAAAGNDGGNSKDVSSPSCVDLVISIGAVDRRGHIANFSSRGNNGEGTIDPRDDRKYPNKKPELVAPGVDIISCWNENGYAKASGTSQAVPFVCGIIALLLESHPEYERNGAKGGEKAVEKFKEIFARTAEKSPWQGDGHNDRYGYGIIQGLNAYEELCIAIS